MRARLLLLSLLAVACTRADLQAIDDIQVNIVDNLLEISGQVCTDPPVESDFPVKVLFIIDGSGSMQFVDNPTYRALAVEEAILRLRSNPAVSFAVIRFNESEVVLTKPGTDITADDPYGADLSGAFTQDTGILQQAVQGLRVADSVTDYQGALATAYQILLQDMLASGEAQLARTKYVIMFLSDGDPFPECCSMASEAQGLCSRSTNIFFCEDPEAIRANPTQLPYLAAGEDYNLPYQIYASVQDIMDLGLNFQVGEIRLHTAFLFDPNLVGQLNAQGCYAIGPVNFVCRDEAIELLTNMAMIGQGVFRDFSSAEQIDFLGFDLSSIKRENALKNLIVNNTNYMPTPLGLAVDSDGDGLTDTQEFDLGMNRLARDTDGDGFSDAIEWKLRRNGFDPLAPNLGCDDARDRSDNDADGLLLCEELLMRSSSELFDTDADGVPDGLELTAGTDPSMSDALSDSDLDGVRNGDEIRVHSGIAFDEANARPDLAYRYRTDEIAADAEGGKCYDFRVKNVQLGTPLARPGENDSYGRNDLLVYVAQSPFDDPADYGTYKVACVQGRYVAPDFKDPPSGMVELSPEDFVDPADLTPDLCVGLTEE
jgi:hypothetical protein